MNKSLIFAIVLLLNALNIFAGVKPPQAVLTAFQQKFPSAKEVKWEKENATEYEANFEINEVECSANFNENGTWVETETEIGYVSLPDAVKKAFEMQVKKKAKESSRIERANNVILYEVEYKKGLKSKKLVFNSDGTMAK